MDPDTVPKLAPFLVEVWLPAIRPTIRPSTYASYEAIIRNHISPRLGGLRLCDLEPESLNSFYANLLAAGRMSGSGGLSPATVIRVHATLHRGLRDAVRWGYLTENVAGRCDPPKQQLGARELRTWNVEELRIFSTALATTATGPYGSY